MPSASAILEQLASLATRYWGLAVLWHIGAALALVAARRGWRPSRRLAALVLAGPLASVAVVAGIGGNPFNATVFGLLTAALVAVGVSRGRGPSPIRSGWQAVVPMALIAFALVYPHFLEGAPWITYLYAAPVGLVPCPTLALVSGFTLLLGGLGSRPWRYLLAAAVLFYGLLGIFRLGVYLDVPLLVAAGALLAQAARDDGVIRRLRVRMQDGLLTYFLLAFAISWGGVLLAASQTEAVTDAEPVLASAMMVLAAMLMGPSVAALGLTAVLAGSPGLRRLGAALLRWRLRLRWYAMPIVTPALLALVLAGLSLFWRRFTPGIVTASDPGNIAMMALAAGLLAGCFEEIGWTGFATPRLLARWGVVRAGVTLGLPWAVWHALPDFWGTGRSFGAWWPLHMAEWVVALTAFRVLMTSVYARTRSLPLAMLMHAGFTGGQALLWPRTAAPVEELIWYGYFAVMLSLAVIVLVPAGDRSSRALPPGNRPLSPLVPAGPPR